MSLERKKRPARTARNKMMDMLARRDHSEKEIRQKLKKSLFSPEEIETAITFGKERHWLPNSEQAQLNLAEKAAQGLHRKKKGIHYINQFLYERGLPELPADSDLELEKALQLVENKFSVPASLDRETRTYWKGRIGRFLLSRGFEMDIVNKILRKVLS